MALSTMEAVQRLRDRNREKRIQRQRENRGSVALRYERKLQLHQRKLERYRSELRRLGFDEDEFRQRAACLCSSVEVRRLRRRLPARYEVVVNDVVWFIPLDGYSDEILSIFRKWKNVYLELQQGHRVTVRLDHCAFYFLGPIAWRFAEAE